MTTPTASELLVQQAREAERLRLLLLASECKDRKAPGHPTKARPDALNHGTGCEFAAALPLVFYHRRR